MAVDKNDIVGGIPLQDRVIEFHKSVCREITKLEALASIVDTYRETAKLMNDSNDCPNTSQAIDKNWKAVYDEILRITESLGTASSAMAKRSDGVHAMEALRRDVVSDVPRQFEHWDNVIMDSDDSNSRKL